MEPLDTVTTEHTPSEPSTALSGILVQEVRVRNYRCLRSVDVVLDRLTVILGQNNAGKSSFLQALFAAIGFGQRVITQDDIFLRKGEAVPPRSRPIVIDILIRPTDETGAVIDQFPVGSPWVGLWASGVAQDDSGRDFVAIRTRHEWDAIKGDYAVERRFLKDWQPDSSKWEESKPLEMFGAVSSAQIEPMALYLLDAQRDIADDLRSRSSFWSKMVEDHGLNPKQISEIESNLSEINQRIVDSSEVFSHIQSHLQGFQEALACEADGISIAPLPRHMRDLTRGMDVVLATRGASSFPLRQQGMGTRSLGTFFTFWAYTTWRQKQAGTGPVHPMMALEEPEMHLHPQAQKALFRQIEKMPGQRIVSTHSPYICAQAKIVSMRHFSKSGDETVVKRMEVGKGTDAITSEDLRKIDRHVMNTRGDMLFAKAIVFFEGETEEQALPDFAERFWNTHPNELGFSFVGVGGHGNYLAFLRMSQAFEIPWFVFADGEAEAIKSVNHALNATDSSLIPDNPHVFVLPNGMHIEAYLASETPTQALIDAEMCLIPDTNEQAALAIETKWRAMSEAEVRSEFEKNMRREKTRYGSVIGKVLPIPTIVRDLFTTMDGGVERASPAKATK